MSAATFTNPCAVSSSDEQTLIASQGGADAKQTIFSSHHGVFEKSTLKCGEGLAKPCLECSCLVDIDAFVIAGLVDSKSFENNNSHESFQTGENIEVTLGSSESEFMMKIEVCLMTMRAGERSTFTFQLSVNEASCLLADGCEGPENDTGLAQHSVKVCASVTLHNFSQATPMWQLCSKEKHDRALAHKTRGTELFQLGQVEAAFHRYSTAVKYLICIAEISTVSETGLQELEDEPGSLKQYKNLKCVCHLNLAACQAKLANHKGVVANCTEALILDSDSVKALYRRAVAYIACREKEKARNDLQRAQKLEPTNKAVASLLRSCLR